MNNTLRCISLAIMAIASSLSTYADSDVTAELRDQNTPTGWTAVSLPDIPEITSANTITITDATYGASTSSSDNTTAIQAALDAVPSAGGMVVVPAGTYLCGPITIKSNTVLHLAAGATLKMLPYGGGSDGTTSRSTGSGYYPNYTTSSPHSYNPLITNVSNSTDIIIEGEGSTSIIDGQGAGWWEYRDVLGTRPSIMRFKSGSRFLVRNIKLQNSPGTNLTLGSSGSASNFTVHDVTIKNPSSVSSEATADGDAKISHNTDGIPVWGPYTNIYDCNISTGDDNVVFDSDSQYGHVWNCTFGRGHGASFGSFTERVHDIIFEDITFTGTGCGYRIKTNRGRSGNDQNGTSANGAVKNIICRNTTMNNVGDPIVMTTYYDDDQEDASSIASADITYQTPEYCNMLFQNITSTNPQSSSSFKHCNPIYMYGLPELYIHDITFDNVNITSKKGMFMAFCKNIYFKNSSKINNTSSSSTYFSKQYNVTTYGNYNGTANSTYDSSTSSYTVKFMNGSATVSTSTIASGAAVSAPSTNPTKDGYTFSHWSETTDGGAATFPYTITASDKTFYAVYTENKTISDETTVLFSIAPVSGQSLNIASKTTTEISSTYATITGGSAALYNGHSSNASDMITGGKIVLGGSGSNYLKITLDQAIQAGDFLVATADKDGGYVSTSTSMASTDNIVSYSYTFPSTFYGLKTIYIGRGSSKPSFTKIQIGRDPSETTTVFSLTNISTSSVSVASGSSQDLASYATITGGSALIHNGHATNASNLISSSGYTCGNSGGSYIKVTLNSAIQTGDVLTTTGGDGGLVATASSTDATDNISGNTFTFTSAFNGKTEFYICRGSSKPTISAITITRTTSGGSSEEEEATIAPVKVTTKQKYNFIVGKDGDADAAIAAANAASGSARYYIFVPDGTYDMATTQSWTLGSDKSAISGTDGSTVSPGSTFSNNAIWLTRSNVSIIGQSESGTILRNTPIYPGISYTSTLEIRSGKTNTYLQDFTLYNNYANGANDKGVAVAFYDRGTNTILKNVNCWSNQDTYTSAATRCYYETSTFAGTVDFICGSGDVWFEQPTLIINDRSGNVITAPATAASENWGYVFNNATVSAATGATKCTSKSYNLGRPWKNAPASTFLNTTFNLLPSDAGWTNMTSGLTIRFHEYGSKNSSGTALDLSSRSVSKCAGATSDDPVLTAAQAATYTVSAVVGNSGAWEPRNYTQQTTVSNAKLSGSTLSWDDSDYALCWVVFKDGTYYDNVITNSITLTETGSYTVRAANYMGGLGTASTAVSYTAQSSSETSSAKTFTFLPSDGTTTGSYVRTSVENPSFSLTSSKNISSDSRFKFSEGSDAIYTLNIPSNATVSKVVFTNCSENYYNNPSGSYTTTTFTVASSGATVSTVDANGSTLTYLSTGQTITSTITGHVMGTPVTFVANGGKQLAFSSIQVYYVLTNTGSLSLLSQSVANNATVTRSGKISFTFDNDVTLASGAAIKIDGTAISTEVSGPNVIGYYTGLEYGSSHTATFAANSVSDEFGNIYGTAISVPFTINARSAVTKAGFDVIVSTADELDAAITAANARTDKTTRYRIFVKNGTYVLAGTGEDKTVTVTLADKTTTKQITYANPTTYLKTDNVSFIGQSMDGVVITNKASEIETYEGQYGTACAAEGIGNGDVLDNSGTLNYFQGLTLKSSMGDARGRDIVLQDKGNKTIFKDACLWGYQDTYTSNSTGRFYFENGVLRGRTDYLCGKGDVYYNKVTLQQCGTGGYLAVPSQPLKYGYIFNECYIKKETSDVTYYLGRPWGQGTPTALFINTKVDAAPLAAGWAEMSNGWPNRFAEYNTTTTSGSTVDTSSRKTTFNSSYTNNPILTADEATYYSNVTRILSGTDGWDPTEYTEQCNKPTALLAGTTLSWTDDDYASSWVVFRDGEYYANPTTNTLTLTEAGSYTVCAANYMGGLGEASNAVEYVDDTKGTVTATVKMTYVDGSNTSTSYGQVTTANAGYNKISNNTVTLANSGWNCNWITYIQVDASNVPANRYISKATLTASVSGSTDSKRTTTWGTGYNSSVWSSVMTYDSADKSITTCGETQTTSSKSATTFETKTFDITDALITDVDKIATILVYETSAAGGYIKDVSVSVDYTDVPTYVTASVVAGRTFGTFSSQYNVDFSDANSTDVIEAYTAKYNSISDVVVLTRYKDVLPAGTGIVLYAPTDTKSQVFATVASTTATVTDNDLVGAPTATYIYTTSDDKYNYVLKSDTFLPLSQAGTIPAGKAYLSIAHSSSSSKVISMGFYDKTNGIIEINEDVNRFAQGKIYNLQGITVSSPTKGKVYIVNGRKFIMR